MANLKFWKNKDGIERLSAHKPGLGKPKKMLGSFEVERELGRGSMGVVYLGRDPMSGREVAIKTLSLSNEFNENVMEDARSRFMREAKILTWLNHPDIVTIYDVGEEHGLAYIVMEFLKGVELTEFSKAGHLLPLPKVLEIMARSAETLGYAHEQSIEHRDVKPSNIMYDATSNSVKVTDFSISRLINIATTQVGLVLGSPPYMSPEQVLRKQTDGRSDLFSLGSTFYQLVSGRLPFEGDSDLDVMYRVAKEFHDDILSIKPNTPPCVCAIINRALTKDLEGRYQSGYEMAADLRQCATTLK